MYSLAALTLIGAFAVTYCGIDTRARFPHSVCKAVDKALFPQFYCTIDCATGTHPLLAFDGYGCWCGFGGSGAPVDDIDACCMVHDKCYDAAMASKVCNFIKEYTAAYQWKCDYTNSTNTDGRGIPECLGSKTQCGAAICECDRAVALCWAQFKFPNKKPRCHRL